MNFSTMNDHKANNRFENFKWFLLVMGIIIFFFLIAFFQGNQTSILPTVADDSVANPNLPINNTLTPLGSVTTCTNFEYSNWGSCNADGEQYRNITKMNHAGCTGGNTIQLKKCDYKKLDVGTAPELLAQIIKQIRTAPNERIESSYISGENGEMTQNLSYQILDESLVIKSTLIHRNTSKAEPAVDFIDTNLDGFVDYWAGENHVPHEIDKNGEEYPQMQTIWGIYLINFVNFHLKK